MSQAARPRDNHARTTHQAELFFRGICLVLLALVWAAAASAAPPAGFEERVDGLREQIGVPGDGMILQALTPHPDALKLTQPLFNIYALGRDVRDYRGTKIVWRGEAVFGFRAAVVLTPEKHAGLSILIKSEDGEIINGLTFELLDHYPGQPANDWPAKSTEAKQQRLDEGVKANKSSVAKPAAAGPSLPLARYVGVYADPWYGQHRNRQSKRQAHHQLQIDAAHKQRSRSLALR